MNIRELKPQLAAKARSELNENPDNIESDIKHIKDWLDKQPHLKTRTEDQWILSFLRGCKFSLENTKKKLDLYYTMKNLVPEMCRFDINSTDFNEILNGGYALMLNNTDDHESPRVIVLRPGSLDSNKHTIMCAIKVYEAILETCILNNDIAMISGVTYIMDLNGVSFNLMTQVTPVMLKKMVLIAQEANPIRMKGIHYINPPKGFEAIYNIFKSLLPAKFKSRLFIHNCYETLNEHFNNDILPKEFNGNSLTINELIEKSKVTVDVMKDWLLEDLKYGSDESKRFGSAKNAESMFGIDGSFRMLNVD